MPVFYIQNLLTGLVIDIGKNAEQPSPGTRLFANTKMTSAPGNAYQLWTLSDQFVPVSGGPTNVPFYWIENANPNLTGKSTLVIDIVEPGNVISVPGRPDTLKQGSLLDAWTSKGADAVDPLVDAGKTGAANQLWSFAQDKASGCYFISNFLTGFVIDVAEGPSGKQPPAGANLDAWPLKGSPENKNQLWQFFDVNGKTVVPAPPASPVTAGPKKNPGSVQQ